MDDLILNTVGTMAGFGLYKAVKKQQTVFQFLYRQARIYVSAFLFAANITARTVFLQNVLLY